MDKAAVLNFFPRSTFILDQTVSVWRNEAYSYCCLFYFVLVLFFLPTPTKLCVSSSASNEETIETAEKTIKTTSYIVNEAKIGSKIEFDDSL